MKKKSMLLFSSFAVMSMLLAGCGGDKGGDEPTPEPPHTHTYDASHIEWDWEGFDSATAVLTCTSCSEETAPVEATIEDDVTTQSSCTAAGERTYTASIVVGGTTYTDTKTETLQKLSHQFGDEIAEVSATCTTDGTKAHYVCGTCGGKFIKEGGNYTLVNDEDLVITHQGHQYGNLVSKVDAQCGVDGMKAHYQCSVCEKYFDENHVETTEDALKIEAMSHSFGEWESVDDNQHKHTCSNCQTEVIEDHTYTYEQGDAGKHTATCSVCDHQIVDADCVYEVTADGYKCACGREATLTINNRINLDLNYDSTTETVVFGDNTVGLGLTGASLDIVKDVMIGETSVWDATNKKFSIEVAKFPGEQTLDITLTNGEDDVVMEGYQTFFVSKIFTTEAELRTFNKLSKFIGGEETNVWDGYFELGDNITLTSYANNDSWRLADTVANTDVDSKLKEGFVGTLDGKGYSIKKLYLAEEKAAFIRCMNGVVKNISFSQFITSKRYASLFSIGGGTVENVFFAPWNITNNYNAPFFGDNCEKGYVPTIKNLVVDTTGEVYGGTFVANYGGSGYQGNLISSNWGGTLPNIDHIRINGLAYDSTKGIADRTGDKEKSIWWFYNYFCSYHFRETPESSWQWAIKSIDDVIAMDKDVAYYEGLDDFGYNESESWINEWNAIWKDGAATRKFTKLERSNEMSLTKEKSTGAAVYDLVKVTSITGAAKTQYSLDEQTWIDCGATIDTTMIEDADTLYVRQLDAQDQVLDSDSIAIDRKFHIATSYYWGSANSTSPGANQLYTWNTSTHAFKMGTGRWEWTPGEPNSFVPARYETKGVLDNNIQTAEYMKVDGYDSTKSNNLKGNGCIGIWRFNNLAREYYAANQTKVIDIKRINMWFYMSDITIVFEDDSTMTVDKFYKPELALGVTEGWNGAPTNHCTEPQAVKADGYKTNEWFQLSYDISKVNFIGGEGLVLSSICTQDTLFNNGVTGDIIGSTIEGKTVKDIRYRYAFDGASFSYNLPQE